LCFPLRPPPPSPTLFPYTTLFRSVCEASSRSFVASASHPRAFACIDVASTALIPNGAVQKSGWMSFAASGPGERGTTLLESSGRSEEHTSELQSLTNLVCRLLLEK